MKTAIKAKKQKKSPRLSRFERQVLIDKCEALDMELLCA